MDVIAEVNHEYGTKQYWDSRYSKEDQFDWFQSYDQLKPIIRQLIPDSSSRILMLGCGNSSLSEDMYADGYENIVNIDYSAVVIERMKAKHADKSMDWLEMDIRSLQFDAQSFDVLIDKGTMDAMMTEKGSVWDPPAQVVEDCTREVDEVLRVLRPNGVFIYVTFGQPHFRRRFLAREGWSLQIQELGEMFHYYCYTLRRAS